MALSKPPVVPPWAQNAGSPDLVNPGAAFTAAGWPLSSTPPARQYFNWILNFCSEGIRYLCERGLPDWDPQETYRAGDIVRSDDGLIRQSVLNNNIDNPPSTSPTAWAFVRAATPPAGDSSFNVATTAFVSGSITAISVVWSQAAGSFVFYKIATLPGGGPEIGSIAVKAVINAGNSTDSFVFDGIFYARSGGFDYLYSIYGQNSSQYQLQVYQESNGQYSVYIVGATGTDAFAQISVTNQGYFGPTPANMVVYANPPASVGSVTGTNVFSSAPGSNTPPLLNAPSSSTYLNAAQIAADYATLTELSNAEATLLSDINTAVAPLAPKISPAFGGTPTAPTAPNGANSDQIANTNWVQELLFRGCQLSGNGYVILGVTGPGDAPLILQWGLAQGVNGGPGPVNINFPTIFPNACTAIVVSSKRSTTGATPTGYVNNLAGTAGTTLSTTGATVVIDRDSDGVQRGFWIAVGY